MKTVTPTTVLLATLTLAGLPFGTPAVSAKAPDARLLDMYAVRDGDAFTVHVLASGDISSFLSDRKTNGGVYRLTLDVPALPPIDSKYDVETPFASRFQVWPMQLSGNLYSRIEIELPAEASSVVGLENDSHLFIRIQHDSLAPAPEPVAALAAPEDESEPEAPTMSPSPDPGMETAPVPNPGTTTGVPDTDTTDAGDQSLFVNLFPAPVAGNADHQTLFNVAAEDMLPMERSYGLRAGRFLLQPSADFSWIRGDNLLLSTVEPFVDRALLARARLAATLLESEHELTFAYEARYRDFNELVLDEKLTHVIDFGTNVLLSPRSHGQFSNHFVHGAFESQEFDPGGEVVGSIDPFMRNEVHGLYGVDFTERLGIEGKASYNYVDFQNTTNAFFDYNTTMVGGAFVYQLSPLTSLLGEYERATTPAPLERPEAQNTSDSFLFTIRGEITPLMRGTVRVGFANVRFNNTLAPQDYTGPIAEADLTRDFGEEAALRLFAGRRTNLSNYAENSHYVSNYARVQLIAPFANRFRLTASGAVAGNSYPLPDVEGTVRDDSILGGSIGLAYFLTPITYFSVDYKYDRRNSNVDLFSYRNNSLQLMVGVGFLSR